MRALFGLILALGGLWLMWLVPTGLPLPWETPGAGPATKYNDVIGGNANLQSSFVAPLGTATLGSNGGAGWTLNQ